MATERLECCDGTAMRGREAFRVGKRSRAGELSEHLPVARAGDVELVEEGGDRLVVAREKLEAIDRVLDGVDALLCHDLPRMPAPPGRRRHATAITA